MKKMTLLLLAALGLQAAVNAQMESVTHQGEIGIALGAAHYFGDLNTKARVNRPKFAAGAFFRKQFGNYIAVRVGAQFAQVGYADKYYDDNEFQRRRNLSFNSSIWELSLQGDFNFFKFVPGSEENRFTPYVTLGASIFSYDPYAYLKGEKHFLRPLGTEGQGSAAYPDRKPYSSMAFAIPFGVGVKYALNEKFNVGFELLHRFTTTDYLDDVSSTYVGADKFPALPDGTPSVAGQLQDRSYELGDPIGIEGRQRGYAKQKDQFITAMFTLSFNLTSYRCPTAQ
ncbi:DUF6089 family protein [Flavihumibacter solisilvae]|uniref:DUF6089 domain-containing protein n=1 Tax=Flavihumibacter solisilvae TaxID=1349421 RepID=A0A0C1IKS1_9BACT|nr:DUF6089 family protein [Flavihumibacter solisilvae]KIC94780.1 hypothetical protein OI18_09910 [Flavihumibacter solisilvae]